MSKKLTAKEYLQKLKVYGESVGMERFIDNYSIDELLENFAELNVKEANEYSETFKGWAVFDHKGKLLSHTIATEKIGVEHNLQHPIGFYTSRDCTIQPITVTVKKRKDEK